jgi:hypothetical protein
MSEGRKADAGKSRLELLPPRAALAVGHVLRFGAEKYAPENWRKVTDGSQRYVGAALRHTMAWLNEENDDPESGLPHLAHAICSLLFVLELELEDPHD